MTQMERALQKAVEGKAGGVAETIRDGLKIRCKFCVYFGKKNGRGWCSKKKEHRARNAGDGCDGFDPKK